LHGIKQVCSNQDNSTWRHNKDGYIQLENIFVLLITIENEEKNGNVIFNSGDFSNKTLHNITNFSSNTIVLKQLKVVLLFSDVM
jgi:hypothetical protein